MSVLRKVAATTAAVGTLGMGVGAYKAHESAEDIRATAASADAIYHQPAMKAQLEGLAHTKDLQTIILLGGAVLLGAGTAAGYLASAPTKKTRPTASHNA